MSLRLFNTIRHAEEEFKPLKDGEIKMYNCGPTVYDYAHIGNLRAYIHWDVLRRVLKWNSYKVDQVMNITDFGHLSSDADSGDDKMTTALLRDNLPLTLESMKDLALKYARYFKEDLSSLNIETPEHMPFASEHLEKYIEIIKKLEDGGHTYKTSDGLYFEVSTIPEYGKLGGLQPVNGKESRIEENKEKRNHRDFALWKFNERLGWNSPWGKGFPGWHIECSGMSMEYLGETIDIHTGGIDHIATHHNNEIAQSETASGKDFANYWLHNAHLQVDGLKMSKSKNNFYTLRTIMDKGFNPLAFRYLVLGVHYRTSMNFTFEALGSAEQTLKNIHTKIKDIKSEGGNISEEYVDHFTEVVNDDLNTAKALAVLHTILDSELSNQDKYATAIKLDEVLGLSFDTTPLAIEVLNQNEIPEDLKELLEKRNTLRTEKNFEEADKVRDEITSKGYKIVDTDSGAVLERLS